MTIPSGAPSYFLTTFGRQIRREKICERETEPDMAQAMHLISGDTLTKNIAAENGTLARWVSDNSLNDREIVERIFLSTLVRTPTERERNLALGADPRQGLRSAARGIRRYVLGDLQCQGVPLQH